jgi:pectate lyase
MIKKFTKVHMVIILMFCSVLFYTTEPSAEQNAFPGAIGFGATTPGGRGGRIIEVTNLNDSGTGSFRAACEASGARIVLFRTGGTIRVSKNIRIPNPYITIAGQTAPGDGILIRGAGLIIQSHDVIVRGLRIRAGDDANGPSPGNRDSLILDNNYGKVYNVVVDHCSLSWAIDENVSIWHPGAHDITISNCIISEGLYNSLHPDGPHSKGLIAGPGTYNITITGNLLAHNDERNPRLEGTNVEVYNNLVYDTGYRNVDIGSGSDSQNISIVGNHFLKGPSCKSNSKLIYLRKDIKPGSKIYVNDNVYNSYTSVDLYNSSSYIVKTAPTWSSNIVPMDSGTVFDSVLANAGANPKKPGSVDSRIINNVKTGKGRIIDSPSDVGGWPNMSRGTAPQDSDEDGIPDTWENKLGIDPKNSNDAKGDVDKDGYSNIEEYINSFYSDMLDTKLFAPDNVRLASILY